MKTSSRIGSALVALAVPLMALAMPSGVTGIAAQATDGGIRVTWNAADNAASYRVFYSHASILNNNGLYDDYEMAAGTETSHTLRNLPAVPDVYVSVLAVDANGEESPYFLEEARVTLDAAAMPSSMEAVSSVPDAMPSSSTAPADADVLRLLSVEAVSATGVVLHFSLPVTIDPNRALEAVTIETASGTKLPMKRFVLLGTDLTIHTDTQEKGIVYRVTVSNAVTAAGSSGQRLAVLPGEDSLLFAGHPDGRMPSSAGTSSSGGGSVKAGDVTLLRLRAQPEKTTYRVDATWQAPAGDFTGYSIAQTTDGGKTYGKAALVDKKATLLTVKNIPAGSFGIVIRTVYADGTQSRGVMQVISLPKLGGTTGSVTGGSDSLPNSGPALWLAVLGAGSVAYSMHRKRTIPAEAVA